MQPREEVVEHDCGAGRVVLIEGRQHLVESLGVGVRAQPEPIAEHEPDIGEGDKDGKGRLLGQLDAVVDGAVESVDSRLQIGRFAFSQSGFGEAAELGRGVFVHPVATAQDYDIIERMFVRGGSNAANGAQPDLRISWLR